MKKVYIILLICSLLLVAADFANLLPYRYSQVILFALLGSIMSLNFIKEYNQNHDTTAKLCAVTAIFCFVTAIAKFFRPA